MERTWVLITVFAHFSIYLHRRCYLSHYHHLCQTQWPFKATSHSSLLLQHPRRPIHSLPCMADMLMYYQLLVPRPTLISRISCFFSEGMLHKLYIIYPYPTSSSRTSLHMQQIYQILLSQLSCLTLALEAWMQAPVMSRTMGFHAAFLHSHARTILNEIDCCSNFWWRSTTKLTIYKTLVEAFCSQELKPIFLTCSCCIVL